MGRNLFWGSARDGGKENLSKGKRRTYDEELRVWVFERKGGGL